MNKTSLNSRVGQKWEGGSERRRAIFQIKAGAASFDTLKRQAVASGQQENLAILSAEEPSPLTFVSRDGKEGKIETASGGLSFYVGSLSRSRDAVAHYLRNRSDIG